MTEDHGDRRQVVLKFGGTSVSSRARWDTIAGIAEERLAEGVQPVIVHSAVAGVSNALIALVDAALAGRHEAGLAEVCDRHLALGAELRLDAQPLLQPWLEDLRQALAGIHLLGEASPRAHARVVAAGELMATTLGAAYLRGRGLDCAWMDVREMLTARTERDRNPRARYLSAACDHDPDAVLAARLAGAGAMVLTQGFIARDARGDTVLLGRGGSDVSASYIAAMIGAERLENWTDVPGMFSADPRRVGGARLLRSLSYAEAQEIATTGSAVLHPRSIPPLRRHGIPLLIRCTPRPELEGTTIRPAPEDATPRLKAISVKRGITLVSMETTGMWQQVGFLARAFGCFSAHGMSVDLVSTSETSVTVSLDAEQSGMDAETLDALVTDLEQLCRVRLIGACAAVSLVGRQIRAILHRLGPALELFEEQRVHLLSQAASDLNLTFVVDEDTADRLVQRLHGLLIRKGARDPVMGPTWEQLFEAPSVPATRAEPWWRRRAAEFEPLVPAGGAAYVYDLETVDEAIASLAALTSVDRVLYAMKANNHPAILQRVHDAGLGFECVSAGELARVFELFPGLDPERVLFTPNFAPRGEYADALERGVRVTVDNLYVLERWPELFAGRELFARLDPGTGRGHHRHVQTAGARSKFGIPLAGVEALARLAEAAGARVTGLHVHAGSGILEPAHWSEMAAVLARVAPLLPEVGVLDVGGGLGVPESVTEPPLDLGTVDATLGAARQALPDKALWLEPGRYLVATAGVLLARVTQTKDKGDVSYVGLSTGMNSLIRPALYGAYHEIVNLSRLEEPATRLTEVVGPICETGDILGTDRLLPPAREGDLVAITNAGAYGRVMSSRYNLREPAPEVVLSTTPVRVGRAVADG